MAHEPLAAVLRHLRRWVGGGTAADASDAQLLEQFAAQQDAAAFTALMARHGPLVLSVCRRMLHDDNDVDDAFQATFAVLVRRAASLRREGSLGSWLYGVAFRVALKARGRAGRQRALEPQAGTMTHEPLALSADNDPLGQAARRELAAVLDEEVNRLPEKYRAALVLCYLEGKSSEQAARELGCPVGSMSWRLDKGRELLRGRLLQRGLVLSAAGMLAALTESAASAAVPTTLAAVTTEHALRLAAGQATATVLSAGAAGLADAVVRSFAVARVGRLTALTLALALLGGVAAVGYSRWAAAPPKPATDGDLSRWIADRVEALQPTVDERKIDRIAWAGSILDGRRLAKETGRPLFLFGHEGRINTGRCGGSAFNLRARAFADERVIALLNQRFVPVYSSNSDTGFQGTGPAAEKAERERIYHATFAAKLHVGDDCIYILTPDGEPFDSISIRDAKQADNLVARLEHVASKLGAPNGPPVVSPKPQSVSPSAPPDALVLHLTARVYHRPAWSEFPAENWIVLNRPEWLPWVPNQQARVGDAWEIPAGIASRVLTHCYPQTENNDTARNVIDFQSLRAVVTGVADGLVRIRLEGNLRMKHTFYADRTDDHYVDATLLGFLEYNPRRDRIQTLHLVTTHATYGPHEFAVAVRSLP